jgi:hypothetical protein
MSRALNSAEAVAISAASPMAAAVGLGDAAVIVDAGGSQSALDGLCLDWGFHDRHLSIVGSHSFLGRQFVGGLRNSLCSPAILYVTRVGTAEMPAAACGVTLLPQE